MSPERWQKVKEIFQSALEVEPAQRAAFLDQACAGQNVLRREVESLIRSHEESSSFMENPAIESKDAAEMLLSDQPQLAAGQRVGHYEIIKLLGEGGMGEVYLAEDTKLRRKVALKFLPSHFTKNPERLRRFDLEARAASALNHPNIITIYEIGDVDGRHFIATEFIDGATLRPRIVERSPKAAQKESTTDSEIKIAEALSIAEQVASALAAAHAAGIIHRDIKPENIMLRRDALVKVLDFGLAKLADQQEIGPDDATRALIKTSTGVVMGTVSYMSPEQARGLSLDVRTDIWSLGVVLYEMIAGATPFGGPTTSDVIVSVLEREPPPLLNCSEQATEEFQRIVSKALTKNREGRYQTAVEIVTDLRRLKQRLEIAAELRRSSAETAQPTGKGLTTAPPITDARQRGPALSRRPSVRSLIAAAIAVFLLTFLVIYAWKVRAPLAPGANIDSLAVLPLVNSSADAEKEYLTDGITESLINSLSQLPNLKVMSRNSVFRFKGKETDAQNIARQLGVRGVMTGNVRQVDDQLVINVEFIDASDGSLIFTRQYVRKSSDLLALQSNIAQDVANNLRAKFSATQQQLLAKQPTTDAEAYQLYLRGKFYANRMAPDALHEAIKYYQQAVDKDPHYALAYSGMGNAYLLLGIYFESPKGVMPQAKAFSMKALELDGSLVDAHMNLGMIYLLYDWDWAAAERELIAGEGLNPKALETFSCTAHILESTGHGPEAEAELRKALITDPLSVALNTELGCTSYYSRQYDSSVRENQDALQMDPSNPVAYWGLARAFGQKKMYQEAINELKKVETVNGFAPPIIVGEMGYVYAAWGKKDEALKIIRQLDEMGKQMFIDPYLIASIYAGLDDKDRAFSWLEKSYEAKSSFIASLQAEPKFDRLRSDARFAAILQRVGFRR